MTDDPHDVHERVARLESLVERQEERLEEQQRTIATQQATIDAQQERLIDLEPPEANGDDTTGDRPDSGVGHTLPVTRRNALVGGGLLALLGLGPAPAAANPQGQVGTDTDPLQALYTAQVNGPVTGGTAVTDLTGVGMTVANGSLSPQISDRQVGRTFAEPDLTLNHSETVVFGGAIVLPVATVSRPGDTTSYNVSFQTGIKFRLAEDVDRLDATISSNTSGASTAYIKDTDDTLLMGRTFSGDTVTFDFSSPFAAGEYYLTLDNDGNGYTSGAYDVADFPYETTYVDITAGVNYSTGAPSEIDNQAYGFSDVSVEPAYSTLPTSGTCHVEWPYPDPAPSTWQSATFLRTLDGESVEVYVETNDGSGWADWSGNPSGGITPGVDLSSIPNGSRVRFRVELGRADTSNRPALNQIARQWIV